MKILHSLLLIIFLTSSVSATIDIVGQNKSGVIELVKKVQTVGLTSCFAPNCINQSYADANYIAKFFGIFSGTLTGDGGGSSNIDLSSDEPAGGGYFIGNGTFLHGVCLSNGNNCVSSSGNASFNQTLTDLLYSPIKWNYNQTIPAINKAQNYTESYYLSQGFRETVCFSMGGLAVSGNLSFGGTVHNANSGWIPQHNGSIIGSTVAWRQVAGAVADPGNATTNLTINGVSKIENQIIQVNTGSIGRFVNTIPRWTYNVTSDDNVTVTYTKVVGTFTVGISSYCVEINYDN